MAVDIGPRIRVDGEAQYRQQIQQIIQTQKTLKAEMQATVSAFDKNATAQEKVTAKAKNLTKQIENQKTRVSELERMVKASSDKFGEADTRTLKWKEALYKAQTELNRLSGELASLPSKVELAAQAFTDFGKKCEAASEKWRSFGQGLSNTGRTMTRAVTVPLATIGAAGVKYIADFDTSMSKVRALAGDASEDVTASVVKMAQETGKAFELTGDTTIDAYRALEVIARQQAEVTRYTSAEAADAMSYMALAGWDVEEMAAGLPGVLNLASASQMDLAQASDIVTDQLTAFGYSAEQAGHFADVLAKAQASSNTTTAQMGEALKYAGSVAGTLDFSIEDVSIALGLMANSSIKASTAGTTLRSIFTNMAKPTQEMSDAMELLGVSLDDGQGNMLDFKTIMDELRAGFGEIKIPMEQYQAQMSALEAELEKGTITEEQYEDAVYHATERAYGAEGALKAQTAAALAGKRGMAGLLAIVNASPEEYDKLTEAIYNADGAAEEMSEIMLDNLEGKLLILKSKLGETAFAFLDGLMPAIEQTVEKIQGLVDKFNSLDETQKETILRVAGIVAVIGPVLSMVGKMSMGVSGIIGLVGKLSGGIGALIPTIAGVLPAVLPLLPYIAIAAAAITGIILVIKNWDKIVEFATNLWQKATTTIATAAEVVKLKVTTAWENMQSKVQGIIENVKGKLDTFKSKMESVVSVVTGKIDAIKSRFDGLRDKVTSVIDTIKSAFNFQWQLPHLSLPHISVNWVGVDSAFAKFFGVSAIPHLSVDWYKKAYGNPLMFTSPTVIPTANGLKGFGDGGGGEIVIGRDMMYGMIRDAVAAGDTYGDINIVINGAPGQDVRELADLVADRINDRVMRRRAAFG